MTRVRWSRSFFVAAIVAVLGLFVFTVPAIADHTSYENATTVESNFVVEFPTQIDRYPNDGGSDNATVRYLPSMQAFSEYTDAPGLYLTDVEIHSPWLDYSDCNRFENISAFGIDRGGNADGTDYDRGLVQHTRGTTYRDGRLQLSFFRIDELGGNPPYAYLDDELVFELGEGSESGPCATLTKDSGWYRLEFFVNGIPHDDPDDYPAANEVEHEDQVGLTQLSTYVYVCDCEDREQAEEVLGPPPNQPVSTPATPTTPTSIPEPSPTATPDSPPTTGTPPSSTPTSDSDSGDEPGTPMQRDGAGFSLAVALLGILISVCLYARR